MSIVASRREQYAQSTRRALLDAGLEAFVERGYAAVSAEELVRAAGLTRGALYHHFDGGKKGLFEAIFEDQEDRAARAVVAAMTDHDDPWERHLAGVDAFLEICSDPHYREIVLLQGPLALGWQRWRELDQEYLGGLVLDAMKSLRREGLTQPHPDDLAAAALYGAITEVALTAARSPDPAAARAGAALLIRDLFEGIRRHR
ncbi:TetR/AcrR family transcriptional regulator [Rhodococcus daqingensis]|uniref:TetR/AcrR family transcriptional regulator n=1 Tax=Rhodococcus daqingensis TaxID=2479363 RepID=A0ABW2RS11_9NOCA